MDEFTELFLRLLTAHMVGDFVLWPARWSEQRYAYRWRSPYLYQHAALQGILAGVAFWDLSAWPLALVVAFGHAISGLVPEIMRRKAPGFLYIQAFHLGLIAILSVLYTAQPIAVLLPAAGVSWARIAAYVFVTFPASALIKAMISRWQTLPDGQYSGLVDAGQWIGIIERILILTFVFEQRWEFIGFLIAAKSVFRFGDLRRAADFRLTEYMLIGTLLSVGLAVLAGLLAA